MLTFLRKRGFGISTLTGVASHLEDSTVTRSVRFRGSHTAIIRDDKDIPENTEWLLRWGSLKPVESVPLSRQLNKSEAISRTSNKGSFRLEVASTFPDIVPFTFRGATTEAVEGPFLVRPSHHKGGDHIAVVGSVTEALEVGPRFGRGWYASKLIQKAHEYRVFVVGGRVISVAEKIPEDPTAIAWNHTEGSSFVNVRWNSWPIKMVKAALDAASLSGLDFSAVDMITDLGGDPFFLEVNTAPTIPNNEDGGVSLRQRLLGDALKWQIERGNPTPPPIELPSRNKYRALIHPATLGER